MLLLSMRFFFFFFLMSSATADDIIDWKEVCLQITLDDDVI